MKSTMEPNRRANAIISMYEALEALARILLSNSANLKANTEKFISELHLSNEYSNMLKNHCDYAHNYRHAPRTKANRLSPTPQETEAFIYTTGLFIRLAIRTNEAT